jgi:undecaprenyl-diphosphatase
MSVLQAIVLGLVQGITEFLPISSTAHLRIAPALLGWPDPGAAFSAVIQLGTVLAVLLYFAKDLGKLTAAFIEGLRTKKPFGTLESRLAWYVGIGTIPVCVIGLLAKNAIETSLRSLYVIAFSMIGLGLILYVAERLAAHRRTIADMNMKDGLAIGFWQALALIPGSSRSGSTITGGLTLGLKREDAARYSFLLSIPATTLAGLFELRHYVHADARPPVLATVIATVVAFGSGWASIAGLLRFLRTRTMMVFVAYRLALGVLLLVLLGKGVLQPGTGVDVPPARSVPAQVAQGQEAARR